MNRINGQLSRWYEGRKRRGSVNVGRGGEEWLTFRAFGR